MPAHDTFLPKSNFYTDGFDISISVMNYFLALRFSDLGSRYPKNGSVAICSSFSGNKSYGTFTTRSNTAQAKMEELQGLIDADETWFQTQDILEDDKKAQDIEENLKYLYATYYRERSIYEANSKIATHIAGIAEEILTNENARNVQGAMFILMSQERKSYLDITPEPETKEIRLTIDAGNTGIQLKP
jgi:hypothetical protein